MLTLTRRSGETIHIGSDIEVTVLSVSGGRVRIGIRAPRELAVHRGELIQRIESQNQGAISSEIPLQTDSHRVITFSEGLFGLREMTRFYLYDLFEGSLCRALVAEDNPNAQLFVVEATEVWPNYPVEECQRIAGLLNEDVAVAAVVTAPLDGSAASVNLVAPLVIGLDSRHGVQIILDRPEFGVKHPMMIVPREGQDEAAAKAQANAVAQGDGSSQ